MPCCFASNIKTARFVGIILSAFYLLGIIMTFSKGQLISKYHFGVFNWPKTNKSFVRISAIASKKRLNTKRKGTLFFNFLKIRYLIREFLEVREEILTKLLLFPGSIKRHFEINCHLKTKQLLDTWARWAQEF